MTTAILVVTTVHHPDDTRIRERLVRSLASEFDVSYAAKSPGPTDKSKIEFLDLKGGRIRRCLAASRLMLLRRWSVLVIHDPELIPAGVMSRLVRRRPVVFDVHEDLEAQIESKGWIPRSMRPVARWVSRALYGLADRWLVITLAEEGYRRLFRSSGGVFPNYPAVDAWPDLAIRGDGSAVYIGDITEARGLGEAVRAAGRAGVPIVLIGPVTEEYLTELRQISRTEGTELIHLGRLPNPRSLAIAARASVGLSPLRPLPNYVDSLPTKTIEYLSVGLPVVATDLPGTREVLEGLPGVVLVPTGDTDALARAIGDAVRDPEMKELTVRSAIAVRDRYQWPRTAVIHLYRELSTSS